MNGREPFAYVVGIEGANIRLNLRDAHRGQVAAHRDGISAVTEIGGLFGVDGGVRLLVLRVRSLSFAEPREAHRAGVGSTATTGEPLRHLEATVVGTIAGRSGNLTFTPDSLVSPALGAEAFPLSGKELSCVLRSDVETGPQLSLGKDTRGGGQLLCGLSQLLSRHVAVLGSTGQGKSCFTAALLQQMAKLQKPRIVIFDINGEYERALSSHVELGDLAQTVLGGPNATARIPYYALGRHGLSRLLLPSEKTQRPALAFAIENLRYVKWFPTARAAGLATSNAPSLFDDCRQADATEAWKAVDALRKGAAQPGTEWPNMGALGSLVAESYALKQGRNQNTYERDAFHYGNVAPLVTRIRRFIEDPLFTSVVDVEGGKPVAGAVLDWRAEGSALCDRMFGTNGPGWKIHLVQLRNVAHDLMPLVLASLLELLAFELFNRGQDDTYPTLLVLEEAHHYLRQLDGPDDGGRSSLAYERLAKEGRKFGLSLWLSTQRPAEVSATVLAQCGTWIVFRLASEQDLKAVAAAGEWVDRQELSRIAGLPRQQAVVFGAGVTIPARVIAPTANPAPKSHDPDFGRWNSA